MDFLIVSFDIKISSAMTLSPFKKPPKTTLHDISLDNIFSNWLLLIHTFIDSFLQTLKYPEKVYFPFTNFASSTEIAPTTR